MMNRKNMTASTLDETALDTYYTLTEGGASYGIGLALAATLNSLKNRNTSSPVFFHTRRVISPSSTSISSWPEPPTSWW